MPLYRQPSSVLPVPLSVPNSNTLEMFNGANQQQLHVYGTRTDGSNYRRGVLTMTTGGDLQIDAQGIGSGATGNFISFRRNGVSVVAIDGANNMASIGSISAGVNSRLGFVTRSLIISPSNGTINLSNNAGTDFTAMQFAGTQVLTTRRTGWGAPTGTATRTAFATGSVTLEQLAERLKALIDDLTTHGLIGT